MYLFCISCKQIVATIKVPTLVHQQNKQFLSIPTFFHYVTAYYVLKNAVLNTRQFQNVPGITLFLRNTKQYKNLSYISVKMGSSRKYKLLPATVKVLKTSLEAIL